MSAAVVALSTTLIMITAFSPFAQAKVIVTSINGTQAYFRELGELSVTASNAHIFTTVSVDDAVVQYNKVVKALNEVQLDSLTKHKGESEGSLINATFAEFHHRLRAARERLTLVCLEVGCEESFTIAPLVSNLWQEPKKISLVDLLRQDSHDRHPRSLAGDAVALASSGLSIYTLSEVWRLNRELVDEENQIQHVAKELKRESHQVQEDVKQVEAIRKQVNMMVDFSTKSRFRTNRAEALQHIGMFAANLEAYSLGLEQIIVSRRPTLSIFNLNHLDTALGSIKKEAKRRELMVLCDSPSEVLQQEVSWLAQEGQLQVFIHLPLVEESRRTLFQYIPTPLRMSNSQLGRPKVEGEFLAISQDNDKVLLIDRATLALCSLKNGVYLCKMSVEIRDPKQSCLGAIFTANGDHILHYCDFEEQIVKSEMLVQIGNSKVWSYVVPSHHITATVSCRQAFDKRMSPASPVLLRDMQEISLDPDCVLTSDRFRIKTAPQHDVTYTYISRPLHEFIDNFKSRSEVLKNILPSKFNIIPPTDFELPPLQHETNWVWILGLCISLVLILSVTLGYCCRNRIRCLINQLVAAFGQGEPALQPDRDGQRQHGHGAPQHDPVEHHLHRALPERHGVSGPRPIRHRSGLAQEGEGGGGGLGDDGEDVSQVDGEQDDLASVLAALGSGHSRRGADTPPLFTVGGSSSTSGEQIRTRSRASSSTPSAAGSNSIADATAPSGGNDDRMLDSREQRLKVLRLDIPPLLPSTSSAEAVLPPGGETPDARSG